MHTMTKKTTRTRRKKAVASQRQLNLNAAGIDLGATVHYVAVPPERDPQTVRHFGTLTEDLEALADWLKACGVTTVAMEATGVYWIPLFQILEDRGFEVCLVNARHVKNVPGRKSDVQDCQWLQYLHSVGLLNASFRPPAGICAVRSLMRHRESLMRTACQHLLRVQKALDQMNVQLHHVVTDITGVTVLAFLGEVGTDVSKFATAEHFASWLGLCPDNRITGGRTLAAHTRKVSNRLATALRMAAQSFHRSKSALGDWFRRIRAKLGTKAAVTAAAHKLARILYAIVKHHTPFDPNRLGNPEQSRARKERFLRRQAEQLGYTLTPVEQEVS